MRPQARCPLSHDAPVEDVSPVTEGFTSGPTREWALACLRKKCTAMHHTGNNLQPVEAAELHFGDVHPLVDQLGCTEGLVELATAANALSMDRVNCRKSLLHFLEAYQVQLLTPIELPVIRRAHAYASMGQSRELIALDRELAQVALLHQFASASQRVGCGQLRRLRPLRDQRVVQRYLKAVDDGEAHGWHTVVYGLTLGLYSLPLRQGLMGYAQQTLRGFVNSAARPLMLTEGEANDIFNQCSGNLASSMEQAIVGVAAK